MNCQFVALQDTYILCSDQCWRIDHSNHHHQSYNLHYLFHHHKYHQQSTQLDCQCKSHVDSRDMHHSVDNLHPVRSSHHHQSDILHCLPHHHMNHLRPIPNYGSNYWKVFQVGVIQPSKECHSHNLVIEYGVQDEINFNIWISTCTNQNNIYTILVTNPNFIRSRGVSSF